jgi:hypothetical protein
MCSAQHSADLKRRQMQEIRAVICGWDWFLALQLSAYAVPKGVAKRRVLELRCACHGNVLCIVPETD